MRYNLTYLEEMIDVPNIGAIIEQIDHAASLATEEMRRRGIRLPSDVPDGGLVPRDVPLQEHVDRYLRYLVASAYEGFMITQAEAPPATPEWEIEGLPDYVDPMFDVTITGLEEAPRGFLVVRIARRLTG